MDRRQFLLALATIPITGALGLPALAQDAAGGTSAEVIAAGRILTGRPDFPEVVIARAQAFQAELDPSFPARLAALADAIAKTGSTDREVVIAGLSDADAATAIQLISPLYLGYTGSPTTTAAVDDAKFVTYLNALMFEPTSDNLLRPSYARGGPNYWTAVPEGVTAPEMPADILEWGAKSPKAASSYATPDPRYVALCQGHAKTLAEAEAWVAANPQGAPQGASK